MTDNEIGKIVVDYLKQWNGKFPLRFNQELAELLRDPEDFERFLEFFTICYEPLAKVAQTTRPA